MEYEIQRIENRNNFEPFKLTIVFNTEKEYVDFHDNIMSKITKTSSHQFHADFYRAGNGEQDFAKGKI